MADVEKGPPQRFVSAVGKDAVFRDADTEVERIMAVSKNFYAVLKVDKHSTPQEIRANYMRLSRLVHPDKCSNPKAGDASATLNQAKDTLTNALKRKMYDAYVNDVDVNMPEGMSQAEWEAQQAMHPVKIPAWLEKVLRIPGAGLILLLILFPLTLILIALMLVLWLVCLPFRCIAQCCGVQPPQEEEVRREQA